MIQLISHHTSEYTTELLMDWITHYNGNVQRVNGIDLFKNCSFNIEVGSDLPLIFSSNDGLAHAEKLWYRRWMEKGQLDEIEWNQKELLSEDVSSFVKSEFDGLTKSFFYCLRNKDWDNIPNFLISYPIKIAQLNVARSLGWKIPQTIITNNKKDLLDFKNRYSLHDIIIKPIKEGMLFGTSNGFYCSYTSKLSKIEQNLENHFFPSLFQEFIKKKFEIRVFFYKDILFPMAIFSSSDSLTQTDFRNYNYKKPNRMVPFKLVDSLKTNIIMLMKKLRLNTGSLDLILNDNNEYVFLEVNPVGQFGMVSFPCNYYIERMIAKSLLAS